MGAYQVFAINAARKRLKSSAAMSSGSIRVAVGCCAELLAEQMIGTWGNDSQLEPVEAFVCGLLHDIGKLALDAVLPKSFARASKRPSCSRQYRGRRTQRHRPGSHGRRQATGRAMAIAGDVARLHLAARPDARGAARHRQQPRLVNLITLADMLVREQHLGYSGNYTFTIARQTLIDAIGASRRSRSKRRCCKLVEQIEPRATALGLGEASRGELYQQRACAGEQGARSRAVGTGMSKTAGLRFGRNSSMRWPDFRASFVPMRRRRRCCGRLVRRPSSVLDVTSIAAFSLIPGQDFAEVLLFDGNGEVFESTLVDCPQRPGNSRASANGPVLAGRARNWNGCSPRFRRDLRVNSGSGFAWKPTALCIGGVVWGALPGEAQRLRPQVQELTAMATGWSLALRTAQIREEARTLSEQLAEANRKLQIGTGRDPAQPDDDHRRRNGRRRGA